jgi:hypothetical protein
VRGLVGLSLVLALAACSGGGTEQSRGPAAGSPTTTHTKESHTTTDRTPRNGRITDAQRYLGAGAADYGWRSFDPVTGTGLFVTGPVAGYELRHLAVVGRTGRIATLTCGRHLPCSQDSSWLSYPATLGPREGEVTVGSGDRTARVIRYDGRLRRTLDLRAAIADGWALAGLAWAPDGDRLAVATYPTSDRTAGSNVRERIWLVGGVDARPEPAYTVRRRSFVMGNPQWSPDGQALLLDMFIGQTVGTDVVVLRLQTIGTGDPVTADTLFHSDRQFDSAGNLTWSPDGTRIAVRTRRHITEISAEDGSVIARHPPLDGWLIWPEKED